MSQRRHGEPDQCGEVGEAEYYGEYFVFHVRGLGVRGDSRCQLLQSRQVCKFDVLEGCVASEVGCKGVWRGIVTGRSKWREWWS